MVLPGKLASVACGTIGISPEDAGAVDQGLRGVVRGVTDLVLELGVRLGVGKVRELHLAGVGRGALGRLQDPADKPVVIINVL